MKKLLLVICLMGFAHPTWGAPKKDKCEATLTKEPMVEATAVAVDPAQAEAMKRFTAYFEYVSDQLVEREDILSLVQVALLAKEHVLLMGPPGNAKSMISDMILGNVTTAGTGEKSYYRIQMTPETTMSETHGPLSPKEVFETGRIVRHYDQGMLLSRNVFIDEIFDARANAQRNILGLLAERQHAQGTEIVPGKIETVIAATNKYLDEVYEKSGDQGPKALLDRFSFNIYVPGEFAKTSSYTKIIGSAGKDRKPVPVLNFEDLDQLRVKTKEVEIPDSVAKFLAALSYRMKGQTEAMEQAALKSYRKKLQNGDNPAPPYRATKYHSPRTLYKAAGILRAYIVLDWIQKGGQRPLVATIDDLKWLKSFFVLNGPNRAFVNEMAERTSNPYERSQLSNILEEDKIYSDTYAGLVSELNEVVYKYALVEIEEQVAAADTAEEKSALAAKLVEKWIELETRQIPTQHSQLNGHEIGFGIVSEFLRAKAEQLVGKENFSKTYAAAKKEIDKKRKKMEKEAAELAEKQAAEKRAKELADARAQKEKERLKKEAEYLSSIFPKVVENPEKYFSVVAEARIPGRAPAMNDEAQQRGIVKLGDTSYVFMPGSEFLMIKSGQEPMKVPYADIGDEDVRAMLSEPNKWSLTPISDTSFIARQEETLWYIDTTTWTIEQNVELDGSDSLIAVDQKGKTVYEIVSNSEDGEKIRTIDLKSGRITDRKLKEGSMSDNVGDGDLAYYSAAQDKLIYLHNNMMYFHRMDMKTMNVTENTDNTVSSDFSETEAEFNGYSRYAYGLEIDDSDTINFFKYDLEDLGKSTHLKVTGTGIDAVSSWAVSPDERYLAIIGSDTDHINIFDTVKKEVVAKYEASDLAEFSSLHGMSWVDSDHLRIVHLNEKRQAVVRIIKMSRPSEAELAAESK